MTAAGQRHFEQLGCVTCHRADSGQRGPRLEGIFGKEIALQGGGTVTADEEYIRESIVNPSARVVAGYQPIMPTYQGLVSEEGLAQLVAYVRSLGEAGSGGTGAPAGTAPPPAAAPAEQTGRDARPGGER
jgi:cytochrome c oxidase subunit 2